MSPRFFAVDTMAVLYRSHFAMIRTPLINSRGVNVSGLRGLIWTLLTLLRRERPDYLAVVSDSPQPTFRHQEYPAYKATREKMPEELVEQLPYIPRLVQALGLPYLAIPGFEADDIIGTLAAQAGERGWQTYMVTGDKDFMQLVGPQTLMYAVKGEETQLTGEAEVAARFGCAPPGVVEVLALMGDASDNVPGVAGVGEKTAIKLVGQFGSLEGLYQNIDQVSGKLKEKLLEHREQAFLSRRLVTIHTQVPLPVALEELKTPAAPLHENQPLIELLTELEFQKFRDELLREGGLAPAAEASAESQRQEAQQQEAGRRQYTTIDSLEKLAGLLPTLRQAEWLAFDTETTGLDIAADRLVGLSLATQEGRAWYLPFNHPAFQGQKTMLLQLLAPLLEGDTPPKCGHNMKFDFQVMAREGIRLGGLAFDTMIASHLVEPSERRHDLDSLTLRRLNIAKIPTSSLIGDGKQESLLTMAGLPVEQVAEYACEDADMVWRLRQQLAPQLEESGQLALFNQVEMALVPVLARMEAAGIRFDVAGAGRVSGQMEQRLEQVREEIYQLAGERDFNINSILDLQNILYGKLALHTQLGVRPKKIKTGLGFSTDEETLEKMAAHPLPRTLLVYRELTKLKNTYLDQLPGFVNAVTGKIHSSFRQTVAATGRLASDNPNLQNIPVRSEDGRKVRALFLPSGPDHLLLSADYSQIELRVVADYSQDPVFLRAFREDQDIHAITAQAIFGVEAGDVTRQMRTVAKEVNFGLIYRMGPDKLALVTGTGREEAKAFIERFFDRYAAVRQLQEDLMERAHKEGFAATRMGRRRYLPEINTNSLAGRMAEGMAINTPIQGTAAEIIKLAMIKVDQALAASGLKTRMVLSVHDELVFDVPRQELEQVKPLVAQAMEQAMALSVPLKVDMGVGENWLAAKG